MAKRFTDTNKYKKPFIRGLPGAYKLLWDYLYHDCDHAGIWIVDFEIAQAYLGKDMNINIDEAIRLFNKDEERIIILNGGTKWFIRPFIEFQYGELNECNRAHNSVIQILKKYNILNKNKPLTSPLQGCKDMDKDKEKDMDKDMDKDNKQIFDNFRKSYPGTKRGFEVEFNNFVKKHKDWKDILRVLIDRLDYQKEARQARKENNLFVPQWKNLQTWINQRSWEDIINTDE